MSWKEATVGTGGSGSNVGNTAGAHDNGYNGGTANHHSIGDNLQALKASYPYRDGYFGTRADKTRNRHIDAENPASEAKRFYQKATVGGIEEPMKNGKGVYSVMADGSVVSVRKVSSSDGSPAVDINIARSRNSSGVKGQKIHFEKKKGAE